MDWTITGYPTQHYDMIRMAKRYAARALIVTGVFMAVALATFFQYDLHPAVPAFGIVIFLLFGLLGGLSGVHSTMRAVE